MSTRLGMALLVLTLAFPTHAMADLLLSPNDAIFGGQSDGANFNVGVAGTVAGANNWPINESPNHVIDGAGQKYLNFGETNTGFIVTPIVGSSVVTGIKLWTANDAEPRDPASYELLGTNVSIGGGGAYALADFTMISLGPLSLPSSRNQGGSEQLLDANSQTISFANSDAFTSYMVIFPSVKDGPNANSMQIAEVQLDGTAVPEPSSVVISCLLAIGGFCLAYRRRR